jgi:hypothetical protein
MADIAKVGAYKGGRCDFYNKERGIGTGAALSLDALVHLFGHLIAAPPSCFPTSQVPFAFGYTPPFTVAACKAYDYLTGGMLLGMCLLLSLSPGQVRGEFYFAILTPQLPLKGGGQRGAGRGGSSGGLLGSMCLLLSLSPVQVREGISFPCLRRRCRQRGVGIVEGGRGCGACACSSRSLQNKCARQKGAEGGCAHGASSPQASTTPKG